MDSCALENGRQLQSMGENSALQIDHFGTNNLFHMAMLAKHWCRVNDHFCFAYPLDAQKSSCKSQFTKRRGAVRETDEYQLRKDRHLQSDPAVCLLGLRRGLRHHPRQGLGLGAGFLLCAVRTVARQEGDRGYALGPVMRRRKGITPFAWFCIAVVSAVLWAAIFTTVGMF